MSNSNREGRGVRFATVTCALVCGLSVGCHEAPRHDWGTIPPDASAVPTQMRQGMPEGQHQGGAPAPEPAPVGRDFGAPADDDRTLLMRPIEAPPPPSAADGFGDGMPGFSFEDTNFADAPVPPSPSEVEDIPFGEPSPPPPPASASIGEPEKPIATSESQYVPTEGPIGSVDPFRPAGVSDIPPAPVGMSAPELPPPPFHELPPVEVP